MKSKSDKIKIEDIDIEITRKKIKNMYLRVDDEGKVKVSAPLRMSDDMVAVFVRSRLEWIRQRQQRVAETPVLAPFQEREMRQALKKQIEQLLAKWEPIMGVKSAGFTIKKIKTRWGSCNVKTHHLNFNLALARVPLECVEYVVVHELTHIYEPSHNARFWALMEHYLPGAKGLSKMLKNYSV